MPHPPYHCLNCHQRLPDAQGSAIVCSHCHEMYAIRHGLPELIATKFLDDFKTIEQHFHDDVSATTPTTSITRRNALFHRHFKQPMMNLPAGSAVLEVAGGRRADGIELALTGKDVTSVDIAGQALIEAQATARRVGAGRRIRFCVADAEHLPFTNHSFDATFVAASFHHFPHQLDALAEMKRVTRPGGYVIWGVEPAAWPYRTIFKLLAPVKRFIRRRRQRSGNSIADDTTAGYTKKQIIGMFQNVGLEIIELKPVKFLTEFYDSSVRLVGRLTLRDLNPWTSIDQWLSRLDAVLEHLPGLNKLFWHWNVISRVPKT